MLELKLISEFPQEIIATDEVGRGPLSGPVVIGAVRILVQDATALKNLLKLYQQLLNIFKESHNYTK